MQRILEAYRHIVELEGVALTGSAPVFWSGGLYHTNVNCVGDDEYEEKNLSFWDIFQNELCLCFIDTSSPGYGTELKKLLTELDLLYGLVSHQQFYPQENYADILNPAEKTDLSSFLRRLEVKIRLMREAAGSFKLKKAFASAVEEATRKVAKVRQWHDSDEHLEFLLSKCDSTSSSPFYWGMVDRDFFDRDRLTFGLFEKFKGFEAGRWVVLHAPQEVFSLITSGAEPSLHQDDNYPRSVIESAFLLFSSGGIYHDFDKALEAVSNV